MHTYLKTIFTFTFLSFITLSINAQNAQQIEVGNFISDELDIEIEYTTDAGLMFEYNEYYYRVYLNEKYIRIGFLTGGPSNILEDRTNSELEKAVFQMFKDIANQINQSSYASTATWSYTKKYGHLHASILSSLPIDETNSWKLNFKTALKSTTDYTNLYKEKYAVGISKLVWPISQNETDTQKLKEAIYWIQEAIELKPDADRIFVYASLLYKTGQTQLALDKVNETIALCKKEGQNYDLSTALKEKLEVILDQN